MIEIHGLVRRFGTHMAVNLPHLDVADGQAVGLVGANGAGKTTLLRLLLDLLRPDAGSVRLMGADVAEATAWKRETGSFLDSGFLLPFLSPLEYFEFTGQAFGLDSRQVKAQLRLYEGFLGHEVLGNASRLIRELSLGNQKKVGIVSALLPTPRLVVLDEPFANLDPPSQIRLSRHLTFLNRSGTTLLISSHDLLHVTDICSRIVVLDRGHLARDFAKDDTTLEELETYFEQSVRGSAPPADD